MYGNSTSRHSADSSRKQMHYSPNLLSCIDNAVANNKVLTIEYDSSEKGITLRDIEPMVLVHKEGKRNLVGWCRLRGAYRSFRLDRLMMVKVNHESFVRRSDFNLADFTDASSTKHYLETSDDG